MPRYKFDNIATNLTGKRKPTDADMKTYIGLEHLESGSLFVHTFGSDVPIKGDKLIMTRGDILLGKRNAYLKRAAIAPNDGLFSAHGMILRPKEEVVDKNFFPFFIASDIFFDEAIKISVGSLSPTINWSDLKQLEFYLPPLEEQRKLADLLWAAYDLKESYKRLLSASDELAKSRFVEMFGDIGTDPYGWGISNLGDCCELNPRRPMDINADDFYSFVPMHSVDNNGHVDPSIIRPYSEVCKGFTYFAESDVLFAKITPCMENGKGGIAQGLKNGVGFGSTEFHVLRPIKNISDPYWLYFITIMQKFRVDAEKVMTGSGGQRRVPITYLSKYQIALPPIDRQKEFASFARQLDKSKVILQQCIANADSVIKSLLNQNG